MLRPGNGSEGERCGSLRSRSCHSQHQGISRLEGALETAGPTSLGDRSTLRGPEGGGDMNPVGRAKLSSVFHSV